MTFADDRRGVSTALNYALTLSITTILITTLLVTGTNFVADQREQAVDTELRVIGQQLAGSVGAADRLVRVTDSEITDDEYVCIERRLPQQAAGESYSIATVPVDSDPEPGEPNQYDIELDAGSQAALVSISLTSRTLIGESRATGGAIAIEFDSENNRLVVRNGTCE